MTARTSHSLRRKAGLAVALATALSLPGIGHAAGDNNTCTTQGTSDPNAQRPTDCPEFTPGFDLDVRYPFRDTQADLNMEMSQARTEANALSWEWYLPAEWRFNTSIRPAGGTPTSCNGLFNANGSVNQAELVSDGLGMIGTVSGAIKYWGRTRFLPSNNASYRPHTAQLAYWRTVGDTTTLCGLVQTFTTSTAANSGGGAPYPVIFPVTLQRGTFGEYGWKVSIPVESIHDQMRTHVPAGDFGLMSLDVELDGLTSGTWNLENGIPARTSFSRAPRNPIQTKIGTRAWVCMSGGPTTTTRYTMATCPSGQLLASPSSGLQEFPLSIQLPPVYTAVPWGTITKAGDTTIPGAGTYYAKPVKGFGYSQDSNLLSINWTALGTGSMPPGVTPAGYVFSVHKVTRHQSPSTASEIAAGRVLFARDFSNAPGNRAISVDLMDMAENADLGSVEGKYNVSMVTVYNTPHGNGFRSDGLCDGASLSPAVPDNGQGVLCPADRPLWSASGSGRDDGTSLYQVLVRDDAWPRRYLHSSGGQPFGVLLLDIPNRRAQYTIWGAAQVTEQLRGEVLYSIGQGIADQGASTVFEATSDVMYEPTGPANGVVRFGNFDLEGEGFSWQMTAAIQGPVPSQIDGPIPDARGSFNIYNPRGGDLDWVFHTLSKPVPTPGSDPTTYPAALLGNVTSPSGTPQMILGDFNGTAF
jgi:hypothetical protein